MERALSHAAVAQSNEVSRAELPFEFMLNALRLKEGFDLAWFADRTGLPLSAIESALQQAQQSSPHPQKSWHAAHSVPEATRRAAS